MANELMQKVGELLGMAGVDEEIIKSVTEKLADENVVLEEEQEETVDEAACEIKYEEAGRGTENAPVDGNINQGGEKVKAVEAEDEGKAPVDPKTNVGGVNVAEAEAEETEEEAVEESEDVTKKALEALLVMVKEAFEQTKQMKADFSVLKEEYAKLVAERIIAEAEDDEVAIEKGEEEDKAENAKEDEEKKESEAQEDEEKADLDKAEGKKEEAKKEEKKAEEHKEEEKKDKKEEDEDYKKAHESLDETADKIAEDVTTITEETVVVEPKTVKIAKAFSIFSNNISESQEEKTEKKQRKAFTLFPNL